MRGGARAVTRAAGALVNRLRRRGQAIGFTPGSRLRGTGASFRQRG